MCAHLIFLCTPFIKRGLLQVPVAQAYNPSYSGGRDRKITVQSHPKARPYLKKKKKTITKEGW
jgi:hypothetical protein